MAVSHPAIEAAFRAHERRLWNLAYRLTGTVADADDVVQETFVRAITRPPADTVGLPWFPWLVRVATNAGRDVLRRRRRGSYIGSWLPSPIETAGEDESPASRYSLVESASFAFLLAVEALAPAARGVVVLRDVFDLSVAETAAALDLSEANVRVVHHRARAVLAGHDRARSTASSPAADQVFARFLAAVRAQDLDRVCALLADEIVSVTDANGEYIAAAKPIAGRERVGRFVVGLAGMDTEIARVRRAVINAAPALLIVFGERRRTNDAPRAVLRAEIRDDQVTALQWVVASRKLAHLAF